jgi:glutamyl-tRNA reductase
MVDHVADHTCGNHLWALPAHAFKCGKPVQNEPGVKTGPASSGDEAVDGLVGMVLK